MARRLAQPAGSSSPWSPDPLSARVWAYDGVIALGLFAAAVAVRLPYLNLVPRYTDEVKEVMWALRIYWGEHLPLAGHNGYTGPLWSYFLAGLMVLVGPSPTLPRTVAMFLGALTVSATYFFAASMGAGRHGGSDSAGPPTSATGRWAGLIAGALMVTSFVPVYVNSHVAWSVCVTPLLTTLALTAVYVGVRQSSGVIVVAAGALVGLATQSHPLGVLLVPASVAWALLQPSGRRMLRTPWPYAAALAAALAYGTMIWFHVSSRFETVRQALDKLSDGVPGAPSAADYRHNVEALAFNLLDLLTAQGHHSTQLFRADPATFVHAATLAILLVLGYAAWRAESLPAVVVVTTGLLMPLVNSEYGFPLGARYLSFLLPVVYAGLALAATALVEQLRARGPTVRAVGTLVVAVTVAAMVFYPLVQLRRAYHGAVATGRTNELVHEMTETAAAEHESGATILLSEKIDAKFSGGGHAHRVMATLLGLSGVPTVKVHKDLKRIDEQLEGCDGDCLLIVSQRQADQLAERYEIEQVPLSASPLPDDGEAYGLYRVRDPAARDRP